MSKRGKLLIAGTIGVIGLIALIVAIAGAGGVRGYLDSNYTKAPDRNGSIVYTSANKPSAVYADVSDAHEPAETVVQPSGYYLRYSDDIVVITGSGSGSRIFVDDERRGYAHWFPIVGGYWGSYGGVGEGFRGGGPGAGK